MSDQYHNKIHAFASAEPSEKAEEERGVPKPLDIRSSHDMQTAKNAFTQDETDSAPEIEKDAGRMEVDPPPKRRKKELSFSDLFEEEEGETSRRDSRSSSVTRSKKSKTAKDSGMGIIRRTSAVPDDEETEITETRHTRTRERTERERELSPSPRETAPVRREPREAVPVRRAPRGCSGVVHNVEHYPPNMVPRKLSRWMRSFFMGVPYSSNDAAVSFYVVSDDAGSAREWHVEAVGNVMGLANGLHVEVIGRQNQNGAIDARRIYHVSGDDPALWPVLADNRQRSAASVRIITLLGLLVAVSLVMAILSILIPAFRFLQAEWPTLVVYAIFIAIGVNWIRRQFRRFR